MFYLLRQENRRTCFYLLRQENRRTCFFIKTREQKNMFFIKTREHENKRGGWRLDWAKREHEVGLGFAQHSLFAYPHLNHWIFHSSLFTLHLNHWIFHFSLFTFLFHYGSPSHLTIISTSLVDSHLTFFLYPCSTSAWCSSGQRLTHIISRFTATCGSVEGK